MRTPTYDELLQTVRAIASMMADGDQTEEDPDGYEMSIDGAFETAFEAISMCRDLLETDGTDLPLPNNLEEVK